jgi:hypothetical protein
MSGGKKYHRNQKSIITLEREQNLFDTRLLGSNDPFHDPAPS